jgi:hypothetical protein
MKNDLKFLPDTGTEEKFVLKKKKIFMDLPLYRTEEDPSQRRVLYSRQQIGTVQGQ